MDGNSKGEREGNCFALVVLLLLERERLCWGEGKGWGGGALIIIRQCFVGIDSSHRIDYRFVVGCWESEMSCVCVKTHGERASDGKRVTLCCTLLQAQRKVELDALSRKVL